MHRCMSYANCILLWKWSCVVRILHAYCTPLTFGGGGVSGGAMVLGKLPVPGRPTIWITVGQWPTALAVGAGGGCLDIFTLIYPFSPLSPSLWETARYRLKYCLKGPLNPKQSTNQLLTLICLLPTLSCTCTVNMALEGT